MFLDKKKKNEYGASLVSFFFGKNFIITENKTPSS